MLLLEAVMSDARMWLLYCYTPIDKFWKTRCIHCMHLALAYLKHN